MFTESSTQGHAFPQMKRLDSVAERLEALRPVPVDPHPLQNQPRMRHPVMQNVHPLVTTRVGAFLP